MLKSPALLQATRPDVIHSLGVAEAPELVVALDELLGRMSARTRRPIRFLEPEHTLPAAMGSDSSLIGGEGQPALPAGPRPATLS